MVFKLFFKSWPLTPDDIIELNRKEAKGKGRGRGRGLRGGLAGGGGQGKAGGLRKRTWRAQGSVSQVRATGGCV